MKRGLSIIAVALAACGPLWKPGKPPPTPARIVIASSSLGSGVDIMGRLVADDGRCIAHREVILRLSSGAGRTSNAASELTDETGEFSFSLDREAMDFQIVAPRFESCLEAKTN